MWRRLKHLKLLREALHVVLVELHDVFDEVLHRDGLHVVCKRKQPTLSLFIPEGRNARQAGRQAGRTNEITTQTRAGRKEQKKK